MSTKCGRRRSFSGEQGQTVLIAVLAMVVLLGVTAMAIDIGMFFEDRRQFQNSADAMALAGVAELPSNPGAADTKAREWATNNGVAPNEIKTIEIRSTDAVNDTVYVEVEGDFGWIFGRALGKVTSKVGAKAAAQIGSLAGGFGAMPWALLQGESTCLDAAGNAIFGADCAVKVGADSSSITGWYGALDYDGGGGGSAEYDSNIIDNTTANSYCVASGASADCDAYIVDALSGNKVGGTDSGINTRLSAEPTASCNDDNGNSIDDFDEVFTPNPGGDPTYSVLCPSPRLIIIPIVSLDPAWPTEKTVTIEGWTLAYLKGYDCVGGANCQSGKGHWEVSITIVDAVYSQTAGFLTAFDPNDGIVVRRLIE
jgi:hypothetical protein